MLELKDIKIMAEIYYLMIDMSDSNEDERSRSRGGV